MKQISQSKSTPFSLNLRAIKLFYKNYPSLVVSTIINAIFKSLSIYVSVYLSVLIVDELATSRDIEHIKVLVIANIVLIAFISLISALIKKWHETSVSNLYIKIEKIYTDKLFTMDFENLDDINTHKLLSKIRQNQNGGGWGLIRIANNLNSLFSSVFTIVGGIILTSTLFYSKVPESNPNFLFLNNPSFILVFIIIIISVSLLEPFFVYKAENYYAKYSNIHNLGNRLFGFYGYYGFDKEKAGDIRIYKQEKICDKYNFQKDDIFSSNGLFAKLSRGPIGAYYALSAIINSLFIGLVVLFICLKSWAGAFGVGLIMQYVAAITKTSLGLNTFVSTLGEMKTNSSFLELVFEFLDIPNHMYRGSLTIEKRLDNKYEIEFRNVSFKYQTSNEYVLKNINLKFKIGSKLAIVGENGSGKTTFIKLLCRLYDPTEGEILLNGINIKKYNYLEYLSIFSVVFQDFKLLSLRLGENVAANTIYDKQKVDDCLKEADFDLNLEKMCKGLDTYLYKDINELGVNVSGGEAQKIAIARALYKDSPFIILDEPTTSLDPIAEASIYSKFNEIVGDKTAVYISHRLSSCVFCDEVAVFDKGEIVEFDTPKKLLADKNSKYFELWNAQAQYYK